LIDWERNFIEINRDIVQRSWCQKDQSVYKLFSAQSLKLR